MKTSEEWKGQKKVVSFPPPVGCASPVGPPSRDDRVACGGLAGSADLPSPRWARHWERRAQGTCPRTPGDPDCPWVTNWPTETLLRAESHRGLRRKRCHNSKAGKNLLLFSDRPVKLWDPKTKRGVRSPQLGGWPPWAFGELEETKGLSSSFGLLPSALLLSVKTWCPKRKSVTFWIKYGN